MYKRFFDSGVMDVSENVSGMVKTVFCYFLS